MLLTLSALVAPCLAQTTEVSRVLGGGGGWSSNTTVCTLVTVGQSSPLGTAESGGQAHYAGFLQTFVLHPLLDTDGDGIPDENDVDNDNDALHDLVELAGTAFDPTTATDPQVSDSDADGVSDGAEAFAGTNPGDPLSLLEITQLSPGGPNVSITWKSRGGAMYDVVAASNVWDVADHGQVVDVVMATGGNGPWLETVTTGTVVATDSERFYCVIKRP